MAVATTALVCVTDFEEHTKKVLPKYAFDYYKRGAGEGHTLRDNKKAFAR